MVTYDAMNMLFQFGIFLASALTAGVAINAVAINKKSNRPLPARIVGDYSLS